MSDFVSILFLNNDVFAFELGWLNLEHLFLGPILCIVLNLLGIWVWDELNPSFGNYYLKKIKKYRYIFLNT
jgi:hypothetical protein